jgi:hypothetical protein
LTNQWWAFEIHAKKCLEVKPSIILGILHISSNDTIEDLYFDFHQSVPITTKVVNSNPTHGEVYLIQHYVIKFVSDLRKVSGFLRFIPPIKLTTMIDITVILLKVALNTITLILQRNLSCTVIQSESNVCFLCLDK